MILTQLVLHNVGPFAGRHVIDLEPSDTCPVILIGGLNGVGKTTILESIQLALYGSLIRTSSRRAGSYENYLKSLIHRSVPLSEGAAIELIFKLYEEGEEHDYSVNRIWKNTGGSSLHEILLVSIDGRYDQSLSATWAERVESFLPRGIAGLFFFDGEQIEALADMDRSRQVLRSALDALLGLDLVEQLSTDLSILRRRHRGERVPAQHQQKIDAQQEVVTTCRRAEQAADENERTRRIEFERCQQQFDETTEEFRSAGGELLEQREATESAVKRIKSDLEDAEEEIRHELGGDAPLLQVGDLLSELAERARSEAEAKRNAILVDALSARDETLLKQLRSAQVESATVAGVEQFLSNDREARFTSDMTEEVVDPNELAPLDSFLSFDFTGVRRRLQSALDRRVELVSEMEEAERFLEAIPEAETIEPIHRARETAKSALHDAEIALAAAGEVTEKARSERASAQDSYEARLESAANANLEADDDSRLVEHADRVGETLQRLRIEATRRHLDRISQLVLEALEVLVRKQNLVTNIHIDPETHTVTLTGSDGHELPATDLSAGERQLVSVALLWGLARAAGRPLPVVIDTPLGRLDGSHREHLVERYFPKASHQVILLSTDTEIDQDAHGRIARHVGREYHLEFDSATNSTYVEDGYFWR